jgi:hypothetical protein
MKIYTAPEPVDFEDIEHKACIFLAGSIEMGKANNWQSQVAEALEPYDIVIFNPRRTAWDSSWEQSLNNPVFVEQVNWELDKVDASDVVFFYFQGDTLSPISLMEMGIACAGGMDLVVVAEPGFWRRGNIEVMCDRHGIPLYGTLQAGIQALHNGLAQPEY